MSNPQIPIINIDLIPHPLDAWRAALNALIAVAPGSTVDIGWHLNDARERTLICRDFSAASQGEAQLIDRLMLISSGRLLGDNFKPARNHLGLNVQARVIGDFGGRLPAAQLTNLASDAQLDLSQGSANSIGQVHAPVVRAQQSPPSQRQPLGATTPAPSHLSALATPQSDRS